MKRGLVILLACFALFTLAAEMLAPVYAVFVERIGGDLLTAGGAYAIFMGVTGILIIIISKWEDRFKHLEKLVVLGFCIKVIGFTGYVFVSKPMHLFLVQVILGLGEAVSLPAHDGLYSQLLDRGKYASEWGMYDALWYITAAVAGIIGGAISNYLGFKMLFFLMIIISLAGLFVSLRLMVDKYKRKVPF